MKLPGPEKPLTCAYDEPWDGDHPLCKAEIERGCRRFAEAVARGEFDREGCTPTERKAQQGRLQAEGRVVLMTEPKSDPLDVEALLQFFRGALAVVDANLEKGWYSSRDSDVAIDAARDLVAALVGGIPKRQEDADRWDWLAERLQQVKEMHDETIGTDLGAYWEGYKEGLKFSENAARNAQLMPPSTDPATASASRVDPTGSTEQEARRASLERAEKIARMGHAEQKDRVTGEPYIEHIERVVAGVEGDEAKTVAWLHDLIEDCEAFGNDSDDWLRAFGFSEPVVEAVLRLTRGWFVTRDAASYSQYIEYLAQNPLAVAVKIADLRDHLRPNCPPSLRPRYEAALVRLSPLPAPPHGIAPTARS